MTSSFSLFYFSVAFLLFGGCILASRVIICASLGKGRWIINPCAAFQGIAIG